jgi:hypothetical protein
MAKAKPTPVGRLPPRRGALRPATSNRSSTTWRQGRRALTMAAVLFELMFTIGRRSQLLIVGLREPVAEALDQPGGPAGSRA